MGALILTKGTRRLIRHLSKEFNKNNIAAYRGVQQLFASADVNGRASPHYLHYLSFGDDIQPNTPAPGVPQNAPTLPAGRSLIPPRDATHHPKLLKRWQYYLFNELTSANQDKIRVAIYTALSDTTFTKVIFDCIEGETQDVSSEPEYDSTDSNDNSDDPASKYMKIVLITSETKSPTTRDSSSGASAE